MYKCINCGHIGPIEDDVTDTDPAFWGTEEFGYTCDRCDYVHYPREDPSEMMKRVKGRPAI